MGTLTAKRRNALPKKAFGMPGERKYPMPDASHAANAKARATQQFNKGNLSASAKAKIDAKANRVMHKGPMTTMDMIDHEVAKRPSKRRSA